MKSYNLIDNPEKFTLLPESDQEWIISLLLDAAGNDHMIRLILQEMDIDLFTTCTSILPKEKIKLTQSTDLYSEYYTPAEILLSIRVEIGDILAHRVYNTLGYHSINIKSYDIFLGIIQIDYHSIIGKPRYTRYITFSLKFLPEDHSRVIEFKEKISKDNI